MEEAATESGVITSLPRRSKHVGRPGFRAANWAVPPANRPPSPTCQAVIAYQGVVGPEAIEAAGRIGNDRRDIGVLAVTSADRLNSGWTAARRARARGHKDAVSQIERLMGDVSRDATLITVTDGHPATLAWIGSVAGHMTAPLGVEHFGQTGTISDLYKHFQIDADAIVNAANYLSAGRRIHLR